MSDDHCAAWRAYCCVKCPHGNTKGSSKTKAHHCWKSCPHSTVVHEFFLHDLLRRWDVNSSICLLLLLLLSFRCRLIGICLSCLYTLCAKLIEVACCARQASVDQTFGSRTALLTGQVIIYDVSLLRTGAILSLHLSICTSFKKDSLEDALWTVQCSDVCVTCLSSHNLTVAAPQFCRLLTDNHIL